MEGGARRGDAATAGAHGQTVGALDNWFSNLFPTLARGDYWVLYLDADYSVALVGNPDRDYLWLLSRTSQVSLETRERLLAEARERGYDTSELIWRAD